MFQFLKKKTFLFLLPVLLLAIFCPLSPVHALIGSLINPVNIFWTIINLVLQIALGVVSLVLVIVNALLNWVASNPSGLPYTNPVTNPVIKIGWTLLRDMTNMLFVLGLAYIGLATALNFLNFDTKKIFPKLILIALLINFTPVICGVVVDLSNIIANFFLSGADFSPILNEYTFQQEGWATNLVAMGDMSFFLRSLILIGYGVITATILFLFTGLFILRYPMIWILVIFSPLAFFAWIFPKTKKYFTQWWDIFLQWCIVIIPASFFLYLSQQILAHADEFNVPLTTGLVPGIGELISNLAPSLIAALFLCIGFVVSLQTSAKGAGIIKGAAIGFGGALLGMTAKGTWKGLKGGTKLAGGIVKGEAKLAKKGIKELRHPVQAFGKARDKIEAGASAIGRAREKGRETRAKYVSRVKSWRDEKEAAKDIRAIGGRAKQGASGMVKKIKESDAWILKKEYAQAAGKGLMGALYQRDTGKKDKGGKTIYAPGMLKNISGEGIKEFKKELGKSDAKGFGALYEVAKGKKKSKEEELLEEIKENMKKEAKGEMETETKEGAREGAKEGVKEAKEEEEKKE